MVEGEYGRGAWAVVVALEGRRQHREFPSHEQTKLLSTSTYHKQLFEGIKSWISSFLFAVCCSCADKGYYCSYQTEACEGTGLYFACAGLPSGPSAVNRITWLTPQIKETKAFFWTINAHVAGERVKRGVSQETDGQARTKPGTGSWHEVRTNTTDCLHEGTLRILYKL